MNFGIATSSRWTDASGQTQEKTEFHNIVAWGKLADIVAQYIRKGSKVFVEGRIQTRDWDGEDGVKRYRTEIVADNVIMLDRKGEGPAMGGMTMEREPSGIKSTSKKKTESFDEMASEEPIAVEDLPF